MPLFPYCLAAHVHILTPLDLIKSFAILRRSPRSYQRGGTSGRMCSNNVIAPTGIYDKVSCAAQQRLIAYSCRSRRPGSLLRISIALARSRFDFEHRRVCLPTSFLRRFASFLGEVDPTLTQLGTVAKALGHHAHAAPPLIRLKYSNGTASTAKPLLNASICSVNCRRSYFHLLGSSESQFDFFLLCFLCSIQRNSLNHLIATASRCCFPSHEQVRATPFFHNWGDCESKKSVTMLPTLTT